MSTLALSEVLRTVAIQWSSITNSITGVSISRPIIPRYVFLYIAIAMAVLAHIFFRYIRKTPLGSLFVSVRENENLAKALGVKSTDIKTIAVVISSGLAALAGSFMAYYIHVVDITYLSFSISEKILIMVILGGIGTIWGPVLGSIIILFEELIRGVIGADFAPITIILYSIILIVVILLQPHGLSSINFNNVFNSVKNKPPTI